MVGLLHATKIYKEWAPFQNWESSVRFQDDPWMRENTVSSEKNTASSQSSQQRQKPSVAARASKENLNISLFCLILAPDCIFILFQLENYTVFL